MTLARRGTQESPMASTMNKLRHRCDMSDVCSFGSSRGAARRRRSVRRRAGQSNTALWGPTHSSDNDSDDDRRSADTFAFSNMWESAASAVQKLLAMSSANCSPFTDSSSTATFGNQTKMEEVSSCGSQHSASLAQQSPTDHIILDTSTHHSAHQTTPPSVSQLHTSAAAPSDKLARLSPLAERTLFDSTTAHHHHAQANPQTAHDEHTTVANNDDEHRDAVPPATPTMTPQSNTNSVAMTHSYQRPCHTVPPLVDPIIFKQSVLEDEDDNHSTTKKKKVEEAEDSSRVSVSPLTLDHKNGWPLESLELKEKDLELFERSISELTMKSSYGQATAKLSDGRRMAYYAVGKQHLHKQPQPTSQQQQTPTPTATTTSLPNNNGTQQQQRGGNRKCYFTGKLIRGGSPFYAGSVQQGLRTLVVFCLPSAIGLPTLESLEAQGVNLTELQNAHQQQQQQHNANAEETTKQRQLSSSTLSSSLDETTFTQDDSADTNYHHDDEDDHVRFSLLIDAETLLCALPEPSSALLDRMSSRYPDQYHTLPVQVRSQECWRIYLKFCFFSGLPIADGDMYYKVRNDVAMGEGYDGKEEILLSHEVMVAVNGCQSADILRLPNKKTFRYLQKHYTQQSGKLSERVFDRRSWDMIMPEV